MALPGGRTTREAILLEAGHQFGEKGFDGTSLNAIAEAVGIRRPSLLHHFQSKEALYREVFDMAMADWFIRVEKATTEPTDEEWWSKVDHVLMAAFDFFRANPDFVRLVRRERTVQEQARPNEQHETESELNDHQTVAQTGSPEPGSKQGAFRRQDPELLLVTGYGALLSYFSDVPFMIGLLDRNPLSDASLDALRDHTRELFRAALTP